VLLPAAMFSPQADAAYPTWAYRSPTVAPVNPGLPATSEWLKTSFAVM
jgi:hypothetical protein